MLRVKAFQHLVFKAEDEFEISLELLVKPDIFLKCVNLLDHSLLLLLCLLMLLTVSFFAFFPILVACLLLVQLLQLEHLVNDVN